MLTDVVDDIADERLQLCQISVGDLGGEALNGTEIAVRGWPRKRWTGTYLEDRVVAVLDCAAYRVTPLRLHRTTDHQDHSPFALTSSAYLLIWSAVAVFLNTTM